MQWTDVTKVTTGVEDLGVRTVATICLDTVAAGSETVPVAFALAGTRWLGCMPRGQAEMELVAEEWNALRPSDITAT